MDRGAAGARARDAAGGRPWRGGGGGGAPPAPAPPKVYRVEPRDFRELVQRLTGAGAPPAGPAPGPRLVQAQRRAAPAVVPAEAAEQFDYAPWFSAPLLSPAYGASGFDGHQGSGALL